MFAVATDVILSLRIGNHIFLTVCTFKVVISCFGMLSLLCFRLNFLEFLQIFVTQMSLLLFVNAENGFDEAVSCAGMVIT